MKKNKKFKLNFVIASFSALIFLKTELAFGILSNISSQNITSSRPTPIFSGDIHDNISVGPIIANILGSLFVSIGDRITNASSPIVTNITCASKVVNQCTEMDNPIGGVWISHSYTYSILKKTSKSAGLNFIILW